MATREEQSEAYNQVLQNIKDGDSFAAYGAFQKLPFMDQMGLYMQPGVGDVIAYVESAAEMEKGKQNFQEGNYGESLGNYLTGGIAAASTIPLVGSVVDAARVGGKIAERGIGGLMNRVRSRMDDGIPGGGGGPKQGSLFEEGNKLIGDFFKQNKLPNVFNRKQMPGTFANTKSINMGDGLQTNVMSSNGVSAGAKVDNILNDLSDNGLDGITYNQSYDKPLTMVARKDGASYEIKTMPGEKGIELSISKIYSKAPTEADVLAEKSSRRLMFSDSIPKERSYRFNDLPEEVSTPVNLNVRKTGDSVFDVDAKSFRLDDFDVNNKSNAVVAKHFDDMGFDKNSIKVFDDDTTGFENMAKFKNMEPDPGSVKNYTFRLENGEEAIDKVQTFTVDGKPVARHYGSDPYAGGFDAYFTPNQGPRGTKPFSKIEESKLKIANKKQVLMGLEAERSQEAQYMTTKSLSALDARIGKLKAEITASRTK